MIYTSGELIRELQKCGDDFITVILDDKEYIIDVICRIKMYTDRSCSHLALKIKDGGEGNIKR